MSFLLQLQKWLDQPIKEIKEIKKGFSSDKKYYVKTNEQAYLVKVSERNNMERKYTEFQVHQRAFQNKVKTNKPIKFTYDSTSCYSIFTYVSGKDASDILPLLTTEKQYAIGIEAGMELKKIHKVKSEVSLDWYMYKKEKNERYWQMYQNSNTKIEGDTLIQEFISENYDLMKERSITLQHDDFHVNNMICSGEKLSAVIDFDRFDWGDPIHDLYKTGMFSREVSIPFCNGLIDGYFQHNIPSSFWRLYNLYTAMIIFPSVVWTEKVTPNLIEENETRIKNILNDHDYFQGAIPSWYKKG
ncbi:aminoglycoside phosphotransferase family protein [Sutcliffiella cohnii]